MNKKLFVFFFLGICIAFSLNAQAVLISGDSPAIVVYDNATNPYTWVSGIIFLTKNDSSVTSITVDLAPKADSPYPRNDWIYIGPTENSIKKIYETEIFFSQSTYGNIIKMWGTDSSVTKNNVYTYTFPNDVTTTEFPYYVVFRHNLLLSPGTYQLPLTFRVRIEGFPKSGKSPHPKTDPLEPGKEIDIKFVVNPSATIDFLSGSSGNTKISSVAFNDVVSTTTNQFRVSVTSNFRYSLSVSSATGHGCALKHSDVNVTETIPYTFAIEGSVIPVSTAPYTVASMIRPTGLDPHSYLASVTIGNVDNYTAGRYSDSISFTVTAE